MNSYPPPFGSQPSTQRYLGRTPTSGFSLVELLVVIGIIVVLTSLAASLRTPESRPEHASEMVSTMATVSHSEALASGARSRVAICIDPTEGEKYLRYVVNLVEIDTDSDPSTPEWKYSGRARTLPEGTIFWPDYSTTAVTINTMQLDLSSSAATQNGTTGSDFIYMEFDGIGQTQHSGMQWVFTKAIMDDAGGAPVVRNEDDRDGFVLRQTGRLAHFQSPDEIIQP